MASSWQEESQQEQVGWLMPAAAKVGYSKSLKCGRDSMDVESCEVGATGSVASTGQPEVRLGKQNRSNSNNNNNNNNNNGNEDGESKSRHSKSEFNSSNNNDNIISKSNNRSYSKILRQYLPSSINLNYALNNKEDRQSFKLSESQKLDHHQARPISKSIVSALSKLKLSSSASVASSRREDKFVENKKKARCCPFDSNENDNLIRANKSVSVERKGFLYLKNSSSAKVIVQEEEERRLQVEERQLQVEERRSCRQRRDLNNNSISSLLSSSSNQRHDEHKTCLLEAEQDEEEEVEKRTIDRDECRLIKRKMSNSGAAKPSAAIVGLFVLALVALLTGRLVSGQQQQQQQQPPFRSQQNGPSANPISTNSAPANPNRPAPQPAAGSLVANINCNKIRGHVTLTPNLRGGTTVSTQINSGPPGEVYQWSVHQFPVKPGAAMCSCSALILGTKLIDLSEMHGNLPSDQEFNVQSSLNLFGADSPVGHSLMLRGMKTGMVACATFLPTSRKSNYRAKFHTPLSGSVTIFQTAFGTSFISHLMYSNGTRRHSMHRFDLVKSDDDIVTTSLLSGATAGSLTPPIGGRETFALEQREHENELSQCRRFTSGEALFKNITYQLAVSTENFGMRGRTSLVLPHIPFETFSSVYLVVYSEYDPSEPIACAPLKFVKPKTAAAKFQSVSVQGSVVFSQDSPYDVTVARINLNMPNSDGHSYGIDELPMIIRRKSDTRVCPNIREIIYNPHHIEPSSVPSEGEATSDQYAVGDLSGKYGSLTGKSSEKIQVTDYNLPLFGPISIVGRAMTIYSAEGVAIACSNVELTTPMTTAFATFDFGIQGQFIFRQPVNDCNGDTYVYIEVSKPVSASSTSAASGSNQQQPVDMFRSLDHNWHIHVNPVDSGLDHLSTTDCSPAGPHYNPYNTSTSSIYSRDCTPFNVLRCEVGDLSAKMFTIDIPPYRVKSGQEPDIGKFFGTDIDLPLCGPVSVVNRSVVVHVQDFGAQRLACSTVIEFKPRTS